MNSHQQNEILLNTLQLFGGFMKSVQDILRQGAAIEEMLGLILDNADAKANSTEPEVHRSVAVADGRKLSEGEPSNIHKDDFDVILDMTTNSLRYRKDPVKHTKLEESKLEGIGPRRIEILLYLLEHPTRHISIENASVLPGQLDIIEPNTLSKTIGILRKALGQKGPKGPYILTESVWGQRYCYAYKLNSDWHYLVIKNEKS
jgi:hypothetical protein